MTRADNVATLGAHGVVREKAGADRIGESDDSPGSVSIGVLDLDLAERTRPYDTEAEPRLAVHVLHLPSGPVDLSALAGGDAGWLGLLILDGLLLAQLEDGRGHVGWLVGEDDLLRPWDMDEISLLKRVQWCALRPSRIALLDNEFGHRAGGIPVIAHGLLSRSARTAHWLLAKSLIVSCPLLEDRLVLLFALLAERWGRVTSDGISLDLPLTHQLLANLCGARRPSVTLSLHALQDDGVLTRRAHGGWLLRRVSPRHKGSRQSSWQSYADALGLRVPST